MPPPNGPGNGNNVTIYTDTFYVMDPYNPPPPGTELEAIELNVVDHRGDEAMGRQGRDAIDDTDIVASYTGDTVTVQYPDGSTETITGATFYLADGREVFTPTDGSTLTDAVLVSTSWTTIEEPVTLQELGITCFTPGVRIRTPDGTVKIETLDVGDLVVTKDNGPQPVRWIGKREVDARGEHAPIHFAKGAIGNRRPLLVSPQHRFLIRDWRAPLYFGQDEVLIAAKHLVNGDTIARSPRDTVTYLHLLFDQHEIIYAEGVTTESFHPGNYILEKDEEIRAELEAIFPELSGGHSGEWPTARPVLKSHAAPLVARR